MPSPASLGRPAIVALAAIFVQAVSLQAGPQQDEAHVPGPSFKEALSLKSVGSPRVSPDGSTIAYTVSDADWEANRYDQEIWLARAGEPPFQLTRTQDGSSSGARWSPDGRWLAFLADRGDQRQVFLISPRGGEARQLTDMEEGVSGFEWSPDGHYIAFRSTDPQADQIKARAEQFGEFEIEDANFRMSHLWVMEVDGEGDPRRLTEGDFTVGDFAWSPDGNRIAFDHRPDPRVDVWMRTDLSVVDVEMGAVTALVSAPGPDGGPLWSPDGRLILFSTLGQDTAWYRNRRLAVVPARGGEVRVLTGDFDENPSPFAWNRYGVWFIANQRALRHIFRLDPASGRIERFADTPEMIWSAHISADARTIGLAAASRSTLGEIHRSSTTAYSPTPVTDMTKQVAGWPLGTREIIQWTSRDGTAIEGMLYKPEGFDPGRRYPLLVLIHGGPTATSRPVLAPTYVYPVIQWLAKDAVLLLPNYRGSAGYGEEFRALNVRNLGVGDAWDVLSGVEHLVDQGIADPEHMGAMGWSQGGYISAFLTTTSDAFQAISVGAGISDWMTYYVNTDIHTFTRMYLKATPWEDPAVYDSTSPIHYIQQASTPTLIQHGEFDRRVPIPNAYELYQGLQDVGVETRLIVYKGFGHGITKPKERLAATWHNWIWFARHVWGEEFQLPVELSEDEEMVEPTG